MFREATQATVHPLLFAPSRMGMPWLGELVNVIKNGGVRIVTEQSLEPSMYWGVRGAESAGFKPEADGEVWVRGGRVSDEFLGCLQQEEGLLLRTGKPRWE